MTTIFPADLLIARLQSQLASSDLARARRSAGSSAPRKHGADKSDAAYQRSPEQLLSNRIAVIDPADPDRRRKIFRAFLETTLLVEFGEQVINDPAFYRLVGEVHEAMLSDAQVKAHIEAAIDALEKLA